MNERSRGGVRTEIQRRWKITLAYWKKSNCGTWTSTTTNLGRNLLSHAFVHLCDVQWVPDRLHQHDNEQCMDLWILLTLPLINPEPCVSPCVCQSRASSGSRSIQRHPRAVRGNQMLRTRLHTCWFCRWRCIPIIRSRNQMIWFHLHWMAGSSPLNPGCPETGRGGGGHKESEGRSISSTPNSPECSYCPGRRMDEKQKTYMPNASWEVPPGLQQHDYGWALTLTFVISAYFSKKDGFKSQIERGCLHQNTVFSKSVKVGVSQVFIPASRLHLLDKLLFAASKLVDGLTRYHRWQEAEGRLNMLLLYSLIDFPFIYVLILDRRCTAQQPGTSDCIFKSLLAGF